MRIRTNLDYERLRLEIQNINQRKMLYKVLKDELIKLGYWKNKERGNPVKAHLMSEKAKGKC
jgi:hypothetical protein